ncbi:hypothetical protein ACFLZX_06225 [Nanoarchaeota archaeon]
MKRAFVLLVMLVLVSSAVSAINVRLNQEFSLSEGQTADFAGTTVSVTLVSIENPTCMSGSFCLKKANVVISQANYDDINVSLYEGESQEFLKLPLYLDSSQFSFLGMRGKEGIFIIQTLKVELEKNSFLPREPIVIRATNTGVKPLVIVRGGICDPSFSVYDGEKFLKLLPEKYCTPAVGRVILRENETKIVATWDQKYFDKCKYADCEGDYAPQGDYYLFVNRIKKQIAIYDPNKIYIVSEKSYPEGTPITIAAQNTGNSEVEITTSPGCVSGFTIKEKGGKKLLLNPPGQCTETSILTLLPGHFQDLSAWNQLAYNHCTSADCEGIQVAQGTYVVELNIEGTKVDKEIVITGPVAPPPPPPPPPETEEKGFFAGIWEWLFG